MTDVSSVQGVDEGVKYERMILIDVAASEILTVDSLELTYCVENASFRHHVECEFMFHVGGEQVDFDEQIAEMRKHRLDVSEEFIKLFIVARRHGATWMMLHG
jgi:hypothetical protein